MEHFYQKIHGWFTFPNLYKDMVSRYESGTFVEVGTWLGKSASYMATEIYNQNKNIAFYCIDTWEGSQEHIQNGLIKNRNLYLEFLKNIQPVQKNIIPYKTTSTCGASLFEDNSIDFVFIDASHDYINVTQDLNTWLPKVKRGGVFAGHDYPAWAGVKQAVDEFISKKNLQITVTEQCWKIQL